MPRSGSPGGDGLFPLNHNDEKDEDDPKSRKDRKDKRKEKENDKSRKRGRSKERKKHALLLLRRLGHPVMTMSRMDRVLSPVVLRASSERS